MIDDGEDETRTDPDAAGAGSAARRGASDAAARAADTPGYDPRPENGADETRDVSGGRVCGFSGCRAALPERSGRGNRAQYCHDGKTWGAKSLSCKQAAQAEENYRSLPGRGESVLPDTSLAALGEHVDRALGPVEQLRTELRTHKQELDESVTEAVADRDAAAQRARDADGRAEVAEQRAAVAGQAATDADDAAAAAGRRADAAESAREVAFSERDTARATQQRAEARLEDAHDREERAERRASEASDRAAAAENQLATRTAERDALSEQLTQLRADVDDERERAAQTARDTQQKIDDLQQQLDQEREQHATALNQTRDDAQAQITQAREAAQADIAAARTELAQAQRDCTAQLGDLRQRLGGAEQQVTQLTERAEDAEQAHQQAGAQLQHWRQQLAEALESTGENHRELSGRVRDLLDTDGPDRASE